MFGGKVLAPIDVASSNKFLMNIPSTIESKYIVLESHPCDYSIHYANMGISKCSMML
jgi:hypothetical protein